MILHEPAETRHREIHVRPPERLPKLTRISREEISQRAEEIYAVEAVWYIGPQSDAIQCSADLPKVFAPRARIRVARLIMILATFAVPCIRPPRVTSPAMSISGPKGSFVRRTAWRVAT